MIKGQVLCSYCGSVNDIGRKKCEVCFAPMVEPVDGNYGTVEVVINGGFGGFGISNEALKLLIEKKCEVVEKIPFSKWFGSRGPSQDRLRRWKEAGDGYMTDDWYEGTLYKDKQVYLIGHDVDYHVVRTNPDLITVVKALGDKANGRCAKLKIVEIPGHVGWTLDEYDGWERVLDLRGVWG